MILLLLGSCQVELLESDGLEGAVEVMKTSLAPFAEQNVEWLVSQVLSFDISKDLESYEVSCLSLLLVEGNTRYDYDYFPPPPPQPPRDEMVHHCWLAPLIRSSSFDASRKPIHTFEWRGAHQYLDSPYCS